MNVSPEFDAVLLEIHRRRAARDERLQRDLHFIDAECERRLRRVRNGGFGGRSVCLRRRCRRRVRSWRRSWAGRCGG